MPRAAALVLALLALLAGCGDSSSKPIESGATTTASQTAQPQPAPASPREVLTIYLRAMKTRQDQYLRARARALAAFERVNTSRPDATWSEAARALRRARDEYNELAVSISEVTPPAALARAHRGMAKSAQLFGQYADGVHSALADREVSTFVDAAKRGTARAVELRGDWRTAVSVHCRKLGVEVPRWVGEVGTTG